VNTKGNQARINLRLIKASDESNLWADTYDREMMSDFLVQNEIASKVTEKLKLKLMGKKASGPTRKSTNADAYNVYLQGQYFLTRSSEENLAKAVGYFEQAIKLDPDFAKAWVGLGESRSSQAGLGLNSPEAFGKAREAVERALELDPDLGEAHAAMAWIQQFHDADWRGADESFKRALALEPGNAIVFSHAGVLARIEGRLDRATALGRRAMLMDPLTTGNYLNAGISLYYAGLYDEATAAFRKALDLDPEMPRARYFLGLVCLARSQPREALAEMEEERQDVLRVLGLALANHGLGLKKESDSLLAEVVKMAPGADYQIAEVYAYRGEADRAFEWLERAYTTHNLAQLKGDPLLKSLVHDPRYAALLKKSGLPL